MEFSLSVCNEGVPLTGQTKRLSKSITNASVQTFVFFSSFTICFGVTTLAQRVAVVGRGTLGDGEGTVSRSFRVGGSSNRAADPANSVDR